MIDARDRVEKPLPLSVRHTVEHTAIGRDGFEQLERFAKTLEQYRNTRVATASRRSDGRFSVDPFAVAGRQVQALHRDATRVATSDAPILILDEPTSALDASTEHSLFEALDRLKAQRTTFIIAHRLSTVRNADCILVLKDGQIVERGRHEELLQANGLYARLQLIQSQPDSGAASRLIVADTRGR